MRRYYPYILSALFFLALLLGKFHPGQGFSELAGFGEDYDLPKSEPLQKLDFYQKPNSTGYDGQFYVQIALDPSLREPSLEEAIDHPSYRSRRILQPALSWLLGLGYAPAILQIHSLLNVACLIALGLLLFRWIPPQGWENFARWFFCVFSMGALESVRYSLADLPAATLALATITLLEKAKPKSAYLTNALAVLSKETSLMNAALFLCPAPHTSWAQRMGRAMIAGLCAAVLFGAWIYYTTTVFPPTVNSSDNIGIPFTGMFRGLSGSVQELVENGFSDRYFFRLVTLPGLLFQFAYLLAKPKLGNRIWVFGILYGILFTTLGDAVWRGYWAGCRITLPMTIAFNILLDSKNKPLFWTSIILSNLAFIHAIIRWI
ncbi:hypothetical protein [Pelagicoccus albus]|uniref:Glycosyltransferase RgtA/B/C/D-like domain-containing protein n=1 Tax=Pelagicoccus albus TaxID=415222 RepID=A0A7X1B794_9BACT|nr:hypothetical protein [Pelagicoccus albus]MBC2606974.1 hypothetical protein [Pelagicoccus albus]